MNWYYRLLDAHVEVRVFMNGALCGILTFRKEEFEYIKSRCIAHLSPVSMFCETHTDKISVQMDLNKP